MTDPETLIKVARHWEIAVKTVRSDIDLHGSPERSLFRAAIEDRAGDVFVLEHVDPDRRQHKQLIAGVLKSLYKQGLDKVFPYLETRAGDFLVYEKERWWQVAPYVAGTPLDRPAYLQDSKKGAALAVFLNDLAGHARHASHTRAMPSFSLRRYILKLEHDMTRHDPLVVGRFARVFDFLRQSFMDLHDALPMAFCHGDYHPLNIIWQDHDIAAVIDWEFCGFKPDLYDAANLVGCIGMEHPSGLTGGLTLEFINQIRQTPIISPQNWRVFVEFVIALRFAWLAEWLRKKDKEMIDTEAVYMNLLLDNREALQAVWGV
ncbi:MAG: phosphotransferase [Thermodesulfobacteriota bacterium]|nr:phosphotransferase [Thermodesulfobacteriota bacterium]